MERTHTDKHLSPDSINQVQEDLVRLRQEKLQAFLRESLADSDGLQANLGAAASGLMRMAARLERAIDEALGDHDTTLADFRKLLAPMDIYLKLTRQYDRLISLKARVRAAKRNSHRGERGG